MEHSADLATLTLQFWNASHFHRRAPNRDQANARKVLVNVAIHSTGRLRHQAVAMLQSFCPSMPTAPPLAEPPPSHDL